MKIFVGSLPYSVEEDELREYFEEYGQVSSVNIIMDKFTGKSRGFGFVEMADDQEAQRAIDELNGAELSGRTLVVNQAEEKRDNTRRNNFGGGNNSGGFNKGGSNRGGGYGNDQNSNRGGYNKGGFNKGGSGRKGNDYDRY